MWAIEDEGLTGVTIDSDGHRLVGVLYLARGEEPKPTVLLLHGCPGLEKNLDLAVRLRDQGWNSLLFHYRGCWGSAGRYDLRTIPRDVTAAVDYLAGCPRVDAGRIAVLGHSLGGWAALVTAAAEPRLRAVAVYGAAARLGASLRLSPDQMSTDQMSTDQMSTDQMSTDQMSTDQMSTDQIEAEFTRFLATTPAEFARQAEEVAERMDGLEAAAAIGPRPLLVVHGTADRWVPVAAARELAARAGPGCRYVEVEGADHAFSWHRAELSDLIIGWLRGENYAT